jgi:iron complex outermembrane receptor protein
VRELTAQLNVTNLLDEEFVSTVGTGGFTVRGDTQTMMAGVRRQAFLTLSTAF